MEETRSYTIHVGNQAITLIHDEFDGEINIDEFTRTDVGNIFGEAVTIPVVMNKVSQLKAEMEEEISLKNLEIKEFKTNFIAQRRLEAFNNGGSHFFIKVNGVPIEVKNSEKALETCFENDTEWITLNKELFKAEKYLKFLNSAYWSLQTKSKTISSLCNGVTPHEFVGGLIESKVNGILIKKG